MPLAPPLPAAMVLDGDTLPSVLRDREAVRERLARSRDRLTSRPLVVLAVFATLLQGYAAYRIYAPLGPGEWPVLRDSVIFEYIGWHLSEGGRLYLDVWEVKPPLAFEVTGLLALLAGENVALYHTLNLLATSGAVVGSAVVAGAVVWELTEDALGAVVGGATVFVLPAFFWRALLGFKSKYFVVVCGLLVVWLVLRDRPLLAGVSGAAVLGFWQLAVVFPVVGLATLLVDGDRAGAGRFVGGGLLGGGLILLPVVAWGALPAMVAEAVLTPLLIADHTPLSDRVRFISRLLGVTIPVVLVGLAAYAGSLAPGRVEREWPLVAATGWFTAVMLFLDFDTLPDLFPWFGMIAVGVGLAVGRGRGSSRRVLAVAVLGMVVLSVVTMGGFGSGRTSFASAETYDTATELEPDFLHNKTERQYLFWNRVEPPTCRLFVGPSQFRVIKLANLSPEGEPYWEAECGRLGPVWDAVVRTYT